MQRLALLGALLAAAPAARAQAPANAVASTFQDVGGYFGRNLIAALDTIPAARYSYRPTPRQQTVGYIAQHVAAANYALCGSLGGPPRTAARDETLPDTLQARLPKDTLVARLRASLRYCEGAFARVSDAGLADSVSLGPPGRAERVLRARVVGYFVADLAEHYAQVASYMRQMGLVPPTARPRG